MNTKSLESIVRNNTLIVQVMIVLNLVSWLIYDKTYLNTHRQGRKLPIEDVFLVVNVLFV